MAGEAVQLNAALDDFTDERLVAVLSETAALKRRD